MRRQPATTSAISLGVAGSIARDVNSFCFGASSAGSVVVGVSPLWGILWVWGGVCPAYDVIDVLPAPSEFGANYGVCKCWIALWGVAIALGAAAALS